MEFTEQFKADMDALLVKAASRNPSEANDARQEIARALETPLRQGVLNGDIHSFVYEKTSFKPDQQTNYPLDFLAPGTEDEHVAYTIPNHGRIPERKVEGDYVNVPTYKIGNSIDMNIDYMQSARWDVVARAIEVLRAGFVRKMNNDAWHCILGAGVDRNIIVYDSDAAAGQPTRRLVSVMKNIMRRNGGGNSASIRRGKLTDLCVSPEFKEGMLNWNLNQVDDITRRSMYTNPDGSTNDLYSVNLHDFDELGQNQEYNDFFLNQLGGTLASGDVELVIGLDLLNNDSFVMPVRKEIQIFEDPAMHRSQRMGYYGWASVGFGVLDNRRVILGSC